MNKERAVELANLPDSCWEPIKQEIEDMLRACEDGLKRLENTRERDMAYKYGIILLEDILNLRESAAEMLKPSESQDEGEEE